MISRIYEQLKTGSIENVVIFGSSRLPPTPYVVVKMEDDALGRGTIYNVFAHMDPGCQLELISYVRNELYNLLNDFEATTEAGNYKKLEALKGKVTHLTSLNDDGTISMSRQFLSPSHDVF